MGSWDGNCPQLALRSARARSASSQVFSLSDRRISIPWWNPSAQIGHAHAQRNTWPSARFFVRPQEFLRHSRCRQFFRWRRYVVSMPFILHPLSSADSSSRRWTLESEAFDNVVSLVPSLRKSPRHRVREGTIVECCPHSGPIIRQVRPGRSDARQKPDREPAIPLPHAPFRVVPPSSLARYPPTQNQLLLLRSSV